MVATHVLIPNLIPVFKIYLNSYKALEGIGLFSERNLSAVRHSPQIKMARRLKTDKRGGKNVLGKIQPSKQCYELAFAVSCAMRLCD